MAEHLTGKPPADWTAADAQTAIGRAIEEMPGGERAFNENFRFVEEQDHWQEGEAWVGPGANLIGELRTRTLAAVERQFTPVDVIGEVLDRLTNALMQREAEVDLIPLEPADEDSEEAERQATEAAMVRGHLSAWWDRVALWERARQALKRSRWAERGALRTWIAPGNLEGGGEAPTRLPGGLDLAAALERVDLAAPQPDEAHVYQDPETRQRIAVFLFEASDDKRERAEIWYVDEDGTTVLRVVGAEEAEDFRVQLGGRLPIVEMEAPLLITEAVRRQQKRLNFTESIMTRVAEASGFPERYTLNAQPNGVWLDVPPVDGPALQTTTQNGKTYYLHSAPRTLGAAITTELVGVMNRTTDGETRATPGVVFKEPTDPVAAISASTHGRHTILRQCHQGHIATDGTGEASGLAYEQARADFEDDLHGIKVPLEGLLRGAIEGAIAWAEAMGPRGAASILERYRVSVTLTVKSGPVSAASQEQHNRNVEAGTLSQESAMAANGVEDVDAEISKIRSQPEAVMGLRAKQVTSVIELAREGVSWQTAARIVGADDEELLALWKQADAEGSEGREQEEAQDDEINDILNGTGVAA